MMNCPSDTAGVDDASRVACIGLGLLVALLIACGGSVARYEGVSYPQVADKNEIKEANQTPPGETVIGQVVGNCEATNRSDLFGLFSNSSCRRDEMRNEMRAKAAIAGGQTLVARRCDTDVNNGVDFSSKRYTEQTIECHADVSRSNALIQSGIFSTDPVDSSATQLRSRTDNTEFRIVPIGSAAAPTSSSLLPNAAPTTAQPPAPAGSATQSAPPAQVDAATNAAPSGSP